MKMLLFFFCFGFSYFAIGQIDSIENEILNYKNSKPEIISKGRRLMIDKLLQADYQKMKEIKDYLIKKVDDDEYQSFNPDEYCLLLFWTQDYDELLASIEKKSVDIIGPKSETIANKIVPVSDQLYQALVDKSIEARGLLGIILSNSTLSAEEIDFLNLHLDYCLLNSGSSIVNQDSLNIQSNKFLIKFPSSLYRQFVKKEIQYVVKVSDFGFGYDFFIGYGAFSDSMARHVNDYAPMGFSMDFCYHNFVLNAAFGFGFAKLNQSVVYQNYTWDKEFAINLFYPQATLGYTFFGKKRLNFNPYFGIYSLMVTPSTEEIQNNAALNDVYINSQASFVAGFGLNLYSKPSNNMSSYRKSSEFQGFVKLKYTYYQSGFNSGFNTFDGDMHTICLSFGGMMRRVYRM